MLFGDYGKPILQWGAILCSTTTTTHHVAVDLLALTLMKDEAKFEMNPEPRNSEKGYYSECKLLVLVSQDERGVECRFHLRNTTTTSLLNRERERERERRRKDDLRSISIYIIYTAVRSRRKGVRPYPLLYSTISLLGSSQKYWNCSDVSINIYIYIYDEKLWREKLTSSPI